MTRISYRALHPAIGAEVLNLDLSVPLDPEAMAEVIKLWEEKSVLIFRKQNLTPEEQLRVTDYFGPHRLNENIKKLVDYAKDKPEMQFGGWEIPGILVMSNVKVDGKLIGAPADGELWFHSDNCYLPETAKGSLLYAIEPTAVGGETCYASGYAAYEALSAEIKSKLDGLMAEFVVDYSTTANLHKRRQKAGTDALRAVHPAVVLHPATERPALFVNRQCTERLIGMAPSESEALLEQLFDFQERPEFVYEHKWQPGDLAVWDNRSCLHARKDFDPNQRRTMRRSTAGTVVLQPAAAEVVR